MKPRRTLLPLVAVLAIAVTIALGACRAIDVPPAPQAGPIAADAGGAVGYQHGGVGVSKFVVGDQATRTLSNGYIKQTGGQGTLAIRQTNGSVFAVPNAHADSLKLPPYGGSPQDHDRFVQAYFVGLGLPAAQIKRVHAMTLLEAAGRSDESSRTIPRVTAYYSVLDRAAGDASVPDSFAWARVDSEGVVVQEGVYWPALSSKVLADAKRLNAVLADPEKRRAFESRVPAGATTATVAIRHASANEDQFEAFACVDVTVESSAARRTTAASNRVSANASVVRHFDFDGTELFLPQEKVSLARQYPNAKNASQ